MPQGASDKQLIDRIDNDFMYHPATGNKGETHERIRAAARDLAITIVRLVPEGRERDEALKHAEQAMFWANAGIARSD